MGFNGSSSSRGALTDILLVMSRTSHALRAVWDMSTSAICLLLSQFAPATARLFAEVRRLHDSLPPVEARALEESMEGGGELISLTQVPICMLCDQNAQTLQCSRAVVCSATKSCASA